jgi:hypothetical protein
MRWSRWATSSGKAARALNAGGQQPDHRDEGIAQHGE